jgi:ferric iron reductase protein FhuF
MHNSSPHPLVDGLRRAGSISPYFNLPIRDPQQEDWISGEDLFLGNDQRLRNLVRTYGQAFWGSSNSHVAGSAFIIAYLTRLVWPVIGQWVREGQVPDVTLGNIVFHQQGEGIDATAMAHPTFATVVGSSHTGHPDGTTIADSDALYSQLKQWLVVDNLDLVVTSLHRAAGASVKISWNAAAYACAQAFHHLFPVSESRETLATHAGKIFDDSSSPLHGQLTMEVVSHRGQSGFFARRRGCCLAWRAPRANGYCANCILTPKEHQDRGFREMIESRSRY